MNKFVKKGLAAMLSAAMLISAAPVMAAEDDSSGGGISLMSLLPIEEVEAELDLTDYLPAELTNIKVSDILSNLVDEETGESIDIPDSATTVWSRFVNKESDNMDYDSWHITKMDDAISIMPSWSYGSITMELIVGSGKQLDTNNTRYITEVYLPEETSAYKFDLYEQNTVKSEDGKTENVVRNQIPYEIESSRIGYIQDDGGYKYKPYLYFSISPRYSEDQDYYVNMAINDEAYSGYEISVYDGAFESADEAINAAKADPKIDITKTITGANMENTDAGYKAKWATWTERKSLSVVYTKNNEIVAFDSFDLAVNIRENDVNTGGLYTTNEEGNRVSAYRRSNSEYIYSDDHTNYVLSRTYTLKPEYSDDKEYQFELSAYNGDTDDDDASFVIKSVVGHFDSLEAAAGATDITSQLFGTGYSAKYNGNGVNFTVFSEKDVWKFTVKVVADTSEPELSDNDYFNVYRLYKGDSNGDYDDKYDSYEIPSEHDSYYNNGYQTFLINDVDADLTNLKPYGYFDEKSKVYQNGELEVTNGEYSSLLSAKNFTTTYSGDDRKQNPDGSLKYTVAPENSASQRNYWVTVAKKVEGSKLFVNGPDEREVLLDNYYGQNHDIFIANIGTEMLTGLKVELTGAKNVKLDDYWTVGGTGNDALAPFTETYHSRENWNSSAELFNVGKIRLIPDGEGEISGTLKISADNGDSRTIELKGHAGNPKIDTETLKEAVKYVPYQSIITTNNMYSWNKVTFSLYSGKLPSGVSLLPSGELYGVPKEKGSFLIKVRAKFSAYEFDDSIASFTLVVNDNTDANVDAQTDEGYEIIKRVPSMKSAAEQVFEFEYDYAEHKDEFQGFYLDGEKLQEGVDYTVDAGSTKITIKSQTISSAGKGSHTIAAEYRSSSTNEVKKAAQNYSYSSGGSSGGSGGGGSSSSSYKVWFEVNGGAWLDAKTIKNGSTIADLPTPERSGYAFGGWFTDEALTKPFDVNTKITRTTTLYAKWIDIYTIWFIENGGEEVADMTVQYGNPTPTLPTPIKTGYIFDGWYSDEALTQPFGSSDEVTASMSLYAKWRADVAPDNVLGFDDINATDWFYNDVDWAYKNKLMVGISNQLFAPNDSVTGGMIVTVLARLAEADVTEYENETFADVYENEWYTPYAKWAKAIGLVEGIPFNPPKEISREWMGIIIERFLDYMDVDYEVTDEYIAFADADEISAEAMDALQKLYKIEIFRGKGDNIMDPQGNTTRAEFAALIQRTVNIMK